MAHSHHMSPAEFALVLAEQAEALLQAKAALAHRAPRGKHSLTPTDAATIVRALDTKRTAGKETRARRKSSRTYP